MKLRIPLCPELFEHPSQPHGGRPFCTLPWMIRRRLIHMAPVPSFESWPCWFPFPSQVASLRGGTLTMHSATDPYFESEDAASLVDIAAVQSWPFLEKVKWFRAKCDSLASECNEEPVTIGTHQAFQLDDAVEAIFALYPNELIKPWRFECVDAEYGENDKFNLEREWWRFATQAVHGDPPMSAGSDTGTNPTSHSGSSTFRHISCRVVASEQFGVSPCIPVFTNQRFLRYCRF